jgi:hypothetical protein
MKPDEARSNPYKGPVPFEVNDPLYGRDTETMELLNRVLGSRLVLLHSVSGAGKTSLLQAGLIPSLPHLGFAHRPLIRVGAEPPLGYKGKRYLLSTIQALERDRPAAEQLRPEQIGRLSLAEYLEGRVPVPVGHDGCVLLFDQFEEVLSADPTDVGVKEAFFDQLGAALRSERGPSPWWAVFAMREDYIPSLEPYLHRLPTRLASRFRLGLLKKKDARDAILLPTKGTRVHFDERVADRLMRALSLVRVQRADGQWEEKEGDFVEPVLLQVVCRLLWERRANPDRIEPADLDHLRRSADATAPGQTSPQDVDRMLEEFYAGEVRGAAAGGADERTIREWIQEYLITEQDLRGQVPLGFKRSKGLPNEVIDRLVKAYVLRREERQGRIWFELAHDRLIGPVKLNNAEWLTRNRTDFQAQALLGARRNRPDELLAPRGWCARGRTWTGKAN